MRRYSALLFLLLISPVLAYSYTQEFTSSPGKYFDAINPLEIPGHTAYYYDNDLVEITNLEETSYDSIYIIEDETGYYSLKIKGRLEDSWIIGYFSINICYDFDSCDWVAETFDTRFSTQSGLVLNNSYGEKVIITSFSFCGDGTCDDDETCSSCSSDCGTCQVSSYCGDYVCDPDEDCQTCMDDCWCSEGTYCSLEGTCLSIETYGNTNNQTQNSDNTIIILVGGLGVIIIGVGVIIFYLTKKKK